MNLFYKYSHLQRFEQQNEKDGRKEKGQMRKEKGQMRNGDGRRKKKKKKKKRLPARNTTAESLSSIISFLKNSQTISCRKQANLFLAESKQTYFLQKASKLEPCRKRANLRLA